MRKTMSDSERLARSEIPQGVLPVVIDSDAYNEIDDQFAILYALLSPERLDVQAIYATHFFNDRAESPKDGMEKSYEEIIRLMSLAGIDPEGFVFHGCRGPMYEHNPESSPAVVNLIQNARSRPTSLPLYVISIGACTNLASALLLAPDILDKVVWVPLLGNSPYWHSSDEFNLENDWKAAQVLFDSGIPTVWVPASGVSGFLLTCDQELEHHLGGKNPACDYLVGCVRQYNEEHGNWSRPIWDIGPVSVLVQPEWAVIDAIGAPLVNQDGGVATPPLRPLIRHVRAFDRDEVFRDMFRKLAAFDLKPQRERQQV